MLLALHTVQYSGAGMVALRLILGRRIFPILMEERACSITRLIHCLLIHLFISRKTPSPCPSAEIP